MVHLSPYPLVERVNLRSLLKATGVLLGTVHRSLKEGEIRGSNLHVLLMLSHKQMAHPPSGLCFELYQAKWYVSRLLAYGSQKLFYIKSVNQRYYLSKNEPTPIRKTKSKRYIQKLMFYCAVARPRYDTWS